jgi:hypothetical protein
LFGWPKATSLQQRTTSSAADMEEIFLLAERFDAGLTGVR